MLYAGIEGGVLCFVWNMCEAKKLPISTLWKPLCYAQLLLRVKLNNLYPYSPKCTISLLHSWLQVNKGCPSRSLLHALQLLQEHGSGSRLSIKATFYTRLLRPVHSSLAGFQEDAEAAARPPATCLSLRPTQELEHCTHIKIHACKGPAHQQHSVVSFCIHLVHAGSYVAMHLIAITVPDWEVCL